MKNTQKHTPGPWGRNIAPAWKYPIIFAGRNTHVAYIFTNELSESEQEANAHLIAAAPDLLRACVAALTIVAREQPDGSIMADLLAAISKAEGRE